MQYAGSNCGHHQMHQGNDVRKPVIGYYGTIWSCGMLIFQLVIGLCPPNYERSSFSATGLAGPVSTPKVLGLVLLHALMQDFTVCPPLDWHWGTAPHLCLLLISLDKLAWDPGNYSLWESMSSDLYGSKAFLKHPRVGTEASLTYSHTHGKDHFLIEKGRWSVPSLSCHLISHSKFPHTLISCFMSSLQGHSTSHGLVLLCAGSRFKKFTNMDQQNRPSLIHLGHQR